MEKEILGNFIAESRKEIGMTQQGLADRLHVTNAAVSKWERGLSYPDLSMLEPLASALNMTVSELMACKRNPEKSAADTDETMRSVLDIAHASSKRHRLKTWVLALCVILGVALLAGLIWGTVRYSQLTSISGSGYARFFCKDIENGKYYVYVDNVNAKNDPQLLRLKCPNRVTWESIVADYSQMYAIAYSYNSLTCEGTLEDIEEANYTQISPEDMVGTSVGFGRLFDLSGSVIRYKKVNPNPGNAGGHLYTIEIFKGSDFWVDEFGTLPSPMLIVNDCRGAVTNDYDNDGIYELLILTKYENCPFMVYDLVDGEIVSQFADVSKIPPDTLMAWP